MIKKLTKHGNSLALVIDKPVLELLKIEHDTPLDITTDGKRLMIEPAQPSARRKKFEEAMASVEQKYGRVFKRLA
jgi:antitoxin component of MazEF toxin-antitoxin module